MALSLFRGGKKGGSKRKQPAGLIDVNAIEPISCRETGYVQRSTGRLIGPDRSFNRACGNRGVYVERLFDPKFLEEIGFPYIERFKQWNWWPFLFQNNDALTNVVKVFYFRGDNGVYTYNAEQEQDVRVGEMDMAFKTTVLGEHFDVDETLIRAYIGDVAAGGAVKVPKESEYPYVEACRDIYGDPAIQGFEKEVTKMGMHNRILHLMVCQVLNPKGGTYAVATIDEIWWMHRIINNDPPNLAAFIVRNMLDGVRHSKTNQNEIGLPYGRLVSRICAHRCSVHDNEPITPPEFKTPFGKKSLRKMGWIYDKTSQTYVRTKVDEGVTLDSLMVAVNNLHDRVGVVEQQQVILSQQNQRIFDAIQAIHPESSDQEPFPSFPSSFN